MLDPDIVPDVELTVRSITTAAKTLRLYPPTSPIPHQAAETAATSLGAVLEREPSIVLNVAREGFTSQGTKLSAGASGTSDLAEMLRSHGVAELIFLPGASVDELLAFLDVVMRTPEEVLSGGGIETMLAGTGVSNVRVVTVSLAVETEVDELFAVEDADEFFRELAADPAKLATWLAAATRGDPTTLAEGIGELANAAGPEGREAFLAAFASAFSSQNADGKDALLGLGIERSGTRDLLAGVFEQVPAPGLSDALTGGLFGKNMMSLSNALTKLPLGERMDDIIAEVRASLPELGRAPGEVQFMEHMVEVRMSPDPERALTEVDPTYGHVAAGSHVDEAQLEIAKQEVAHASADAYRKSVGTMLALLDQQRSFDLYVRSLDALAGLVPKLVKADQLALALRVLDEIASRESSTDQAWPELTQRLRNALRNATSVDTMTALLDALLKDPANADQAQRILRHADETSHVIFVERALARREDAVLDAAEQFFGRRMTDLLAAVAPRIGGGQLPLLVRRLDAQSEPAAARALEAIARRPDEQSRADTAAALAGTSNLTTARLLGQLLGDPSPKVATAATRALAKTHLPGAAEMLSGRLDQLDIDGKDFDFGRELVGALAQQPDPAAHAALTRLAERRVLIKRGRFAEVQQMAREALQYQAQRGGGR